MKLRPPLFLDRDGVICENQDAYIRSWDEFRFLPGAIESLVSLSQAFRLVVVTNQSALGRGLVTTAAMDEIHARMCRAVEERGGTIEAVLVCPHLPETDCRCRKPKPGLIIEARRRFGIGDGAPFFIGDHLDDMSAAIAAGCKAILVETGRGGAARPAVEQQYGDLVTYLAGLQAAAQFVLSFQPPAAIRQASAGSPYTAPLANKFS